MRSILLTASMLIAGSTLAPEVWCQSNSGPVVIEKNFYAPNHTKADKHTHNILGAMTKDQAMAKVRSTRADDETMYNVTFTIEGYNPEDGEWNTGFLGFSASDGAVTEYRGRDYEENGNFQYKLPAGTYTLIAILERGGFDRETSGIYMAVKENVVVNGDMTVSVPLSEIKNHIVFDMLMPDGSDPFSLIIDDEGNVLQDGNMYGASLDSFFYIQGTSHCIGTYSSNYDIWQSDGQLINPSLNFNFFVNDNSTLAFGQSRNYVWPNGTVIGAMSSDGSESQEVKLGANDFKPIEAEYTDIDNSFADNGSIITTSDFKVYTYSAVLGNSWISTSGYYAYMPDTEWNYKKFYVSTKEFKNPVSVHPIFFNEVMSVMDTGGEESMFYGNFGISTPVASAIEEGIYFSNWHSIASTGLAYQGPLDEFNVSFAYPERWQWKMNPLYSFNSTTENPVKFGGTCPFTLFMRYGNELAYYPIGARGEVRSIDWLNSVVNVKRNGKALCDNYFDYVDMVNNPNAMKAKGPWDFTIDNTNFSLDGVKGRNYAEIHIAKTEADGLFPTMTGYAPRTATGEICNKFNDTKDNAVFSFTAGSFYHVFDMETFRISFLYTPLTEVKVEYAPYNTEEWQVFNVNEVEDKFFMPGWGAYYEGALSQIDRKALNGCFDVRISLADEAGNTQVQTISPAFVIESLSGVERVSEKTEGIYVNGRDIIAPANAQVYTISGQMSGHTQLEPGIYIVRSNGTNKKVIIK